MFSVSSFLHILKIFTIKILRKNVKNDSAIWIPPQMGGLLCVDDTPVSSQPDLSIPGLSDTPSQPHSRHLPFSTDRTQRACVSWLSFTIVFPLTSSSPSQPNWHPMSLSFIDICPSSLSPLPVPAPTVSCQDDHDSLVSFCFSHPFSTWQ